MLNDEHTSITVSDDVVISLLDDPSEAVEDADALPEAIEDEDAVIGEVCI